MQPNEIDTDSIMAKWNQTKNLFFNELVKTYKLTNTWSHIISENTFKEIASVNQLKPGELMLPFRIMLVGGKYGPGVFDIASILGKEETIKRIEYSLNLLNTK